MKTTTEIGRYGEMLAAEYLKKKKYKITDCNYHASHYEIDIIAENKQYIVFVEVKTRSCESCDDLTYGSPASAVTYSKQKRTIAGAYDYLAKCGSGKQPRLDIVEVYLKKGTDEKEPELIKINHIENAFGN